MSTFLLTWKPDRWGIEQLEVYLAKFHGGERTFPWSCGTTTKSISPGDRAFLMKQGSGEKGIFGAGYVASDPYPGEHYDTTKKDEGKIAYFVKVRFEQLFDPRYQIKVKLPELQALDEKIWRAQGSGKRIPPIVARQLEDLWRRCTGYEIGYAEEIREPSRYAEGAKKRITVNAYERDENARRECIEYWGLSCVVCRFHFEHVYGEIGRGYIHVHHLQPLAEFGEEYQCDPIEDLRPVCPNCHAMLHRSKPPLSIEELQQRRKLYGH